jgi:hypothetical protein
MSARTLHRLCAWGGMLVVLGTPVFAFAQPGPTRERVMSELDLTDRRIEVAQSFVRSTGTSEHHPIALSELSAAEDLQRRARTAFTASDLILSTRLTLEARRHADRAIAVMRNLPDPDRVQIQLERTEELIQRTRDRIEECNMDRARSLLRAATEMQRRAEEAARASRYLAALQLTIGARERAHRALRMCKMEENLEETARRALQRTEALLDRVTEAIASTTNDAARESLARARELQIRATRDFRDGQHEASLRQTQSARAFAYRAARLAGVSI